jgi:hypothetical protein
METIIYGILIGGIIVTVLMELKGKVTTKNIEFRSIFPTTKDEWTEHVLQATVMSRGMSSIQHTTSSSYSTSNHIDDDWHQSGHDPHDPYTNPGLDIVVDESYHGIDHGSADSHHH